jgi:hypothetical protein
MSKKEKKSESEGMIWANIIVPDPVKGGKSRKNLAFRCQVAVPIKDQAGGLKCVKLYGGEHDGYEVFPAYGVSLRKRAPKGRKDSDVPEQGRLC